MWKKAVLLGALGFALGVAIGVILTSADPGDNLRAAFPYILVCGIPGCIAMGSSVIYDIEEWSLVRASVTHFVTMGAPQSPSLSAISRLVMCSSSASLTASSLTS